MFAVTSNPQSNRRRPNAQHRSVRDGIFFLAWILVHNPGKNRHFSLLTDVGGSTNPYWRANKDVVIQLRDWRLSQTYVLTR